MLTPIHIHIKQISKLEWPDNFAQSLIHDVTRFFPLMTDDIVECLFDCVLESLKTDSESLLMPFCFIFQFIEQNGIEFVYIDLLDLLNCYFKPLFRYFLLCLALVTFLSQSFHLLIKLIHFSPHFRLRSL